MKKIFQSNFIARNNRKYSIIVLLFFLGAIILSCFIDLEKFWAVVANITVVFGGLGLIYTFIQLFYSEKVMTKEMVLLEIELSNELNQLEILNYSFNESIFINDYNNEYKKALEYASKIDIFAQKELICINELSLLSGNKLKRLIMMLIKLGYDLLPNKDAKEYLLLLKYKKNIINIFNELLKEDNDLTLLNDKVNSIEKAELKNQIAVSIINAN